MLGLASAPPIDIPRFVVGPIRQISARTVISLQGNPCGKTDQREL
jgi:hypothetical protein